LPFGVVGVAGAPGNEDQHRVLTVAVCELVTLSHSLLSAQCTGGGILYSEAVVLAGKEHDWDAGTFQDVLGLAHSTKMHRQSAYLLE